VLVIITFRPEFALPWIGRPQVMLLSLNRLPARRRAEMVLEVIGGKALPNEITDEIVDRTDGVPLFIEELTKAVVESRVLADSGDRYTVTGPVGPLAILTTLCGSLLARLHPLALDAQPRGSLDKAQFTNLRRMDFEQCLPCASEWINASQLPLKFVADQSVDISFR